MSETYRREDSLASRQAVINNYLDGLDKYEQETAQMFADDFLQDGKPLANTLVLIPVAAHQEASNVYRAMSQYARQEAAQPFSILLSLNYPFDHAKDTGIQDTLTEIEQAQAAFPHLDIRTTTNSYSKRPIIGEIRRDLWNGALLAAQQSGCFEEGREVIGLNQDIDLVHMSRHYIARIQHHYRRLEGQHIISDVNNAAGTQLKHAVSSEHPLISRAIFWNDFVSRLTDSVFEAGLVIPMSLYAKTGGIDPSSQIAEVFAMLVRAKQEGYTYGVVKHTYAETSPRRYIEKLDQHGWNVWHDDTFGANDSCRNSTDYPDISPTRLHDVIARTLSTKAQQLFNYTDAAVSEGALLGYQGTLFSNDPVEIRRYYEWHEVEVHKRLERVRAVASRALLHVTDSPTLVRNLSHYINLSEITAQTDHRSIVRGHDLQHA